MSTIGLGNRDVNYDTIPYGFLVKLSTTLKLFTDTTQITDTIFCVYISYNHIYLYRGHLQHLPQVEQQAWRDQPRPVNRQSPARPQAACHDHGRRCQPRPPREQGVRVCVCVCVCVCV